MFVSWFQRAYFHVSLGSVWLKEFKFRLQIASYKFRCRQTFCTSLSSVEIHFQSNRYFTTFIVFSTSMLFIYWCATFIKRIIHNLLCSDALCMRNNVQYTLYMIVLWMNVTPAYYLCSIGFCNCRSSRILPRILGASFRQTKIIIRYIHIWYTRFLAEF